MGKKIFLLLSSLVLICKCTWMQKIEREIKPKEKYDIQIDEKGCAIYEDGRITLSLEIMNDSHWEDLLAYDLFINKKSKSNIWRTPKLLFMHMVITNNGDNPVNVKDIKFNYKNFSNLYKTIYIYSKIYSDQFKNIEYMNKWLDFCFGMINNKYSVVKSDVNVKDYIISMSYNFMKDISECIKDVIYVEKNKVFISNLLGDDHDFTHGNPLEKIETLINNNYSELMGIKTEKRIFL